MSNRKHRNNKNQEKKEPVDRLAQFRTYMGLQYKINIEHEIVDDEEFFNLRVDELPGLLGTGNTFEEAKKDLEEARAALFTTLLKKEIPIPLPTLSIKEIKTFFTGEKPINIQTPQPYNPVTFVFDQAQEKQGQATENQPKALVEGIEWSISSKPGKVEKATPISNLHHVGTTATGQFEKREKVGFK